MKKQFGVGIILSLLSQLITIVIWLFYKPFLINTLGENEYGLYQLVQSVINFLNILYFGFNGAYIRYYSIARDKNTNEVANVNGMFLKVFFFLSIVCAFAGVMILFSLDSFFNKLSSADLLLAKKMFVVLLINLVLSFPMTLFSVYISANERFVFLKIMAILLGILQPLLSLPILLNGYGGVGVVSITLFLSIVRFFLVVFFCIFNLNIKINLFYFDSSILRELFKFTFFIFLSDAVDQLNTNVDSVLLGKIIGTSSVTLYSVGYDFRYYYIIFSWIIPELFIPKANRIALKKSNYKEMNELFTRVGRYNNFILLFFYTCFLLFGKQFIYLWIGDGYEVSYYVGVILISSAYIPSVQTLGVNIQNAMNKHKSRSVVYFTIACLNVLISVGLIKKYHEIGTSIGTLVSVFLGCGLFMNYYYYRHLHLDVLHFWKKVMKWTLICFILCLFIKLMIRNYIFENIYQIFISVFAYAVAYFVLLFFAGIEKEEKKQLFVFLKKH